MGCAFLIGGIFKGIFNFLRWCFTNGIKGVAVLAVTVVIIVIAVVVIKGQLAPALTPQEKQAEISIPALSLAPYIVQTPTRYYYAAAADKDKKTGVVTMANYYELDGNKWTRREMTLVLDPQVFGNITITKRGKLK